MMRHLASSVLRQIALLAMSVLIGVAVAAVGLAYADATGNPASSLDEPPLYRMLGALFVLAAVGARLWLDGARSIGDTWQRTWRAVAIAVIVAAAVVVAESLGILGDDSAESADSDDNRRARAEAGFTEATPTPNQLWADRLRAALTPRPPEVGIGPECPDCLLLNVGRIVDGDTLIAGGQRIRLYGISAPEPSELCASDATRRLRELAGSRVRLQNGPRLYDTYDRRLAYLYTEGGLSIDAALVWGGYARAWTRDGQHRGELIELEVDARRSGRGCLW